MKPHYWAILILFVVDIALWLILWIEANRDDY